jgi:ribosomal protein S12 methylthiotransferase accessory factor
MDPALTLARIRPHLAKAGITRLADITDLDTLDVPVAVAVRPASGTLAVEGGKGITREAAFTSAAMEGIERYVAEEALVVDVDAAVPEVSDRLPVAPDAFPLLRAASLSDRRLYEWSWMRDLSTDTEHLAPADLVGLPVNFDGIVFRHPWAASSNGLASGNHLLEALCAGLYEVIERDAVACWQVAAAQGARSLLLDPTTIRGELVGDLVERLARRGLVVNLFWCPTDIGVPTFTCYVVDDRPGAGAYKGYGCHLDPEIAMVRAVTEAVQARTIFVAGARDDLMRSTYAVLKRTRLSRDDFERESAVVAWDDVPDRDTGTFHGDIEVLLGALSAAGFEHVLARELDAGDFEVAVARVIVPGLEPYLFSWSAYGDRARHFDAAAFVP